MLGEDKELAEGEDNPMAEDELPTIVKRAVVPRLWGQQKKKTTLKEEGHISEEGEMVEEEELPTSATSVTSGGTGLLSVLKGNKLVKEERMSHSQRKQRHHPRK